MGKQFQPLKYFLIGLSLVIVSCEQKEPSGKWYKGNLHTHSFWSDGDDFPEMIMDWYKSRGYDFVALSDHNVLAEGEKWVNLSPGLLELGALEKYREKYGADWVEVRQDTSGVWVRLMTLEEYRPLFEEPEEFLIIKSEEITDRYEDLAIHMNATNIQDLILPQGGNSVTEVMQNNLDAVIKQREKTGAAILPHVNHPNFTFAITAEDLIALSNENFFEVFNGHPYVNNKGDSVHMGTEEMWDLVNISRASKGQPLMYGLATDDSHHYHRFDKKWSNAGRGWIVVRADTLSAEKLIESMEKGDFYASTGVELDEVRFRNNTLEIRIREEEGVSYITEVIGIKKDSEKTEILFSTKEPTTEFHLSDDLYFVRARITSDRTTSMGEPGMAWVQPVKR